MANPNLNLLIAMAQAMGPLCEQVVFVGGCATGLLVDDVGLMDVRPTEDVDAIVEVASLAAYHRLAEQLMQRGFKQTMADNTPPFRWFWNRMQLDLVPLDEKVLGFANAWYRAGFEAALSVELADGLQLRHLSAPHFLATKFEAFKDRGQNDVYLSHDLEDIMTVMEGRSSVAQEMAAAHAAVRKHVGQSVAALLDMPTFHNALPGLLSDPEREQIIKARLMQIAQLKQHMNTTTNSLVQKLWNYCNVLRDDGMSYGDYVEQLTYLLFLKMADERSAPPYNQPSIVPAAYAWPTLLARDGDELFDHYRHAAQRRLTFAQLGQLGQEKGTLGLIFGKAQNKFQDPAKLRRVIVDLIDAETWTILGADVKGDAYEGLLEKNAQDTKSGAGQYFTPRALIQAMVDCIAPQPGERIPTRPVAPAAFCSPRTTTSPTTTRA
jgi:predicted nucleotidyltransferase